MVKVTMSMRRSPRVPPVIRPPTLPCERVRAGWRDARATATGRLKLITFALFGGDVRLLLDVHERKRRSCI